MITSGTRRMTLVSQFSIHTPFNAHYSCTRFCVILAILKRRRLLKSTSIFGSLFCQLTRSMQTPFLAHSEQKHSLAYPNHCSFVSHCYSFFFFLLLKRSKGAENSVSWTIGPSHFLCRPKIVSTFVHSTVSLVKIN